MVARVVDEPEEKARNESDRADAFDASGATPKQAPLARAEARPSASDPVKRVRAWASGAIRQLASPSAWAHVLAMATVVGLPIIVLYPWLANTSTYGFHDWDVQTSHRYLVKKTLLEYGQFPGWNPYACGGFPAWGYVEGGTTIVSPWLPFYLLDDMRIALRVEVLGMALFGALGTYLAAGTFTKSPAARAFVVAIFAVNGRWALQAAAGHTWHLAYALLPWCFFLFERARQAPFRVGPVVWLGAAFAGLIYAGGIYPLPHTILVIALWALGLVVVERSHRPLLTLAAGGVVAVGLAAPKLFPLLATFHRAPREIASDESLDLRGFVTLLTSRDQSFGSRPAPVTPYGWHEWGMYIGLPATLALGLALLFVTGKREAVLKLIAVFLGALGFGAFHEDAPWPWMHAHLPIFRSQHVPSRFLYPAVLIAGFVFASGIGRALDRARVRAPWIELFAVACVGAMGADIALVAELPMKEAMWMEAPDRIPTNKPFSFVVTPPYQYKKRDWAGPMYLAMIGNTGVIDCYGTPPFEGKGALARTDPRYRGEAVVESGAAKVLSWSPNRVSIGVEGASDGAALVYNMNFDEGWSATAVSGGAQTSLAVFADADRLAVHVPSTATIVTFSYTPPRFHAGLSVFALTVLALGAALVRERRRG